jgi:serine protease Do
MKRWSVALAFLALGVLLGAWVSRSALMGQPQGAPAVPKDLTSYRDVVKRVLPAVVSVESKLTPALRERGRRPGPELDPRTPEDLRKFFEEYSRPPQDGEGPPRLGFGSGFLVDPKGVVLTNYHVVEGADQVTVQLKDGRKFTSKEIKVDPKSDLALVRIESKEALPFLEFADSDAVEIGDRVLAVGAPFGLTGSVTHGIISGKGRSLRMNMYEDFLQTDAAINPGNSGGPLVGLDGKVVGVNSAIKTRSGGFQGVGLAINSNLARDIMTRLLKDGVVKRGYLGVQIKDLTDEGVAERLGVAEGATGVLVTQVYDRAPAAKAGVKEGDVITSLGDRTIRDGRDLQMAVAALPLNQPVKVTVLRDGKSAVLEATIEEQPETFGSSRVPLPRAPERGEDSVKLDKVGLEVADLTPNTAERLGYREGTTGVVVVRIDPEGAAARSDLARGMLITRVDKTPVATTAELKAALDKAALDKGVLLQVQSPQGGTNYVLLQSGSGK